MKLNEDEIKKSVDYKILIKSNDVYFKVGTIVIKTHTGDILYTPSDKFLDDSKNQARKEIEHVSWHAAGRVHIKFSKTEPEEYDIIQKNGERQKISEIGFQELIRDTIKDYQKLPVYQKKVVELDAVFEVGDYVGPVEFYFSMVSGKMIVAQYRGEKVPIKNFNIKKDLNGFNVVRRALGRHSGSGDVMLQYSLRKSDMTNLRTGRQFFISHDMKISKLDVKV